LPMNSQGTRQASKEREEIFLHSPSIWLRSIVTEAIQAG
jgi:hypothetical protein